MATNPSPGLKNLFRLHLLYSMRYLLLLLLIFSGHWAMSQGPTIDPTFVYRGIFQPASVKQAIRQPDGKTLLLGPIQRVAGQPVNELVRLLPNGSQPDTAFQANVAGLQGVVDRLVLLSNGKLLLVDDIYYGSPLAMVVYALAGVSRTGLLQLNADGSPDTSFNANLGASATIRQVLPQPDGKLLLFGDFSAVAGQTGPTLLRLNPDGITDSIFQPAVFGGASPGSAYPLTGALQPDGKLVVVGSFTSVGGQPRPGIARLLPAGGLDQTFQPSLTTSLEGVSLAIQPDGKILVITSVTGAATPVDLRRLLPNGTIDPSFYSYGFSQGFYGFTNLPPVVQPDGKILIATRAITYGTAPIGHLIRLLADGTLDPGFDNVHAALDKYSSGALLTYPGSLQLLANGQLLIATGRWPPTLFRYPPLSTSLPVGVALLNADGTHDATFTPLLQDYGQVNALDVQPDGKLLVGGNFSEINGTAVQNLARLLPNGVVDASFAANTDATVYALARQPDGKVVIGGEFDYLNGAAHPPLARLLPTGQNDAAFAPSIFFGTSTTAGGILQLKLRPSGEILASGRFVLPRSSGTAYQLIAQFQPATGLEDAGFQAALPQTYDFIQDFLIQSSGKVVVAGRMSAGGTTTAYVWRLSTTGALDPGFIVPTSTSGGAASAVAQDGNGRLYVGGSFDNLGAPGNHYMGRLLADGQPDPTFQIALNGFPAIFALLVQPNGRILLGGALPFGGANRQCTLRLLPTGAIDNSYDPNAGPIRAAANGGSVNRLLLQPNGAILAAGSFTAVSSLPLNGLVRLLDTNVLAVTPRQAAPLTAAWPVPARGVLHLALDAAARPQRVELLDALGRPVLAQAVTQPDMSLDTAALPPGVYVLRVQYGRGGAVTRRVVLE